MREDFVLDYGGVVVHEDEFDGEGGDFGDEDSAEGVGKGCIDAYEGERGLVRVIFVEFNAEVLMLALIAALDSRTQEPRNGTHIREFLQAPLVVFARVMAGEVGRGDIRNGLGVDTNNLSKNKPSTP